MDPRVESAIRRACDQLGQDAELFLKVARLHLNDKRLHPATKTAKRPQSKAE